MTGKYFWEIYLPNVNSDGGRVKTNGIVSHKSPEHSKVQAELYLLSLKTHESGGEA